MSIFKGFIENITVRYHFSPTLRRFELGTFAVGTVVSGFGIAVPPGLSRFELFTQCDSTCMGKVS